MAHGARLEGEAHLADVDHPGGPSWGLGLGLQSGGGPSGSHLSPNFPNKPNYATDKHQYPKQQSFSGFVHPSLPSHGSHPFSKIYSVNQNGSHLHMGPIQIPKSFCQPRLGSHTLLSTNPNTQSLRFFTAGYGFSRVPSGSIYACPYIGLIYAFAYGSPLSTGLHNLTEWVG